MANTTPTFFHTTQTGVDVPVYIRKATHPLMDIAGPLLVNGAHLNTDEGRVVMDAFSLHDISHAAIVCSRRSWDLLSEEERIAALLHEEGHFVNGDLETFTATISAEELDVYEMRADAHAITHLGGIAIDLIREIQIKLLSQVATLKGMQLDQLLEVARIASPKRCSILGL